MYGKGFYRNEPIQDSGIFDTLLKETLQSVTITQELIKQQVYVQFSY